MIMGARHALVVNALNRRLVRLVPESGWSTTCQTPIVFNESNVLEPDLSVVQGTGADFLPNYVDPAAVRLLIEVADSSVAADRITKKQKYARAGVPVYWLVNLDENQIEVYTAPNCEHESYSNCRILFSGDEIEFHIPGLPVHQLSVKKILDGTI